MSGPALYRYFAGRDELITERVRDAHRSLADTLATAAAEGADLAGLPHALRGCALADPQRYFLVYGTPVPGYHAPEDTTAIADEVMRTLVDACAALAPTGPRAPDVQDAAFTTHLPGHRDWAGEEPAPPEVLHRFPVFWTRLHGVLSLELAGHFTGTGFRPALLFEAELDGLLAPGF